MSALMHCRECGETAEVGTDELAQADGSLLVLIVCGHCAHEYPAAIVSAAGVELYYEISALRKAGQGTTAEFLDLLARYKREVRRPS